MQYSKEILVPATEFTYKFFGLLEDYKLVIDSNLKHPILKLSWHSRGGDRIVDSQWESRSKLMSPSGL